MRTPKVVYPNERIIYKPKPSTCPHCKGKLVMYNYLAWDKPVQTLDRVLSVASRPGHCADPACRGHDTRILSAEGQQIALPGFAYGYDVLARIGWLRQERRDTYTEIQLSLSDLPPLLDAFLHHLDKVSTNYWSSLFPCYDMAELPRTNNDLASHFP